MSDKDYNEFVEELNVKNLKYWSTVEVHSTIKNFFIQCLFDVSTDAESVRYNNNRATRILAKSSDISYRFTIICNSKGSITIELYDIDRPSKMEELIKLDWKVGDWRGLRQNITNKSFIEYGSDGFIYKVFIPTLVHLNITCLQLGSRY